MVFEMDWLSLLVGVAITIITAILVFEYQRWRGRKTETTNRKREVVSLLKSELNKFISSWENFKKVEEMHVDPGLSNFQLELDSIARSLRNISSTSEKLISEDILNKTNKISSELTRLSMKRFYINGGRSWNEFIELGNKIVEQCKELIQKLAQFV